MKSKYITQAEMAITWKKGKKNIPLVRDANVIQVMQFVIILFNFPIVIFLIL